MTDQLLPPNPSKDGWYWVQEITQKPDVWCWKAKWRGWSLSNGILTPREAAQYGCRLASPHPIPMPEQLEALHALPDAMVRAELAASDQADPKSIAIGRGAAERSAAMLRAALGAKPGDPPGNGLDDVRAAAMDQWGIPRAGEETAP